jgi:hypothetical protein
MTGIDPERRRRRLRWAADQLGLDAGASADEVRAAWMRQLAEEDFVPAGEGRRALAVLLGPAETLAVRRAEEAAAAEEEERLRDEVEAFAARFWEAPPTERRARWEDLSARCAFAPALRARLGLLEPGLGAIAVPRELAEDGRVVELGRQVRDQFVLRPGPRARARQEALRRTRDYREDWQDASWRLRQGWPALAALGTDFLNELEAGSPPPEQPERAAEPAGSAAIPGWVWTILGALGLALVRGCASLIHHNPPPPEAPFVVPQDNEEQQRRINREVQDLLEQGELRKRQKAWEALQQEHAKDGKQP